MAISPHVLRRLKEVLGTDAADYLVQRMEGMDATRGEIGELRHEMQLGFARIDARFQQMDARFQQVDARFEQMDRRWSEKLDTAQARMEALMQKGLREQTRFFFVAWSVILAAIVGLYAR